MSQNEPGNVARVEAPAAKDPNIRKFIMAGMLIVMAVLCLRDPQPAPSSWDLTDSKNYSPIGWYVVNNIGPYVFLPGALVFVVLGALGLRRKMVADEEGIGYEGDEQLKWGEVAKLDATKIKKGLLYLHDAEGGKLTLDSWRLTNYRDLVAFVEKHVPVDKQTL